MLHDLERKLLRILWNMSSQRHRMPSWSELERMTGRSKQDIHAGLKSLEEKIYILWEDKPELQSIKIIEGWDRDVPQKVKPREQGHTEYWTEY